MHTISTNNRAFDARLIASIVLLASVACTPRGNDSTTNGTVRDSAGGALPTTAAPSSGCGAPLETRAANAPQQTPAFEGQTRGCSVTSNVAFDVVVLARGLQKPWSVEPMPNGDLLITEKPGRLRIVSAAGEVSDAIAGVPAVDSRGQGGLLDVELSPDFATDRTIFFSFSEPREGGNGTSVARARSTSSSKPWAPLGCRRARSAGCAKRSMAR